MSTLLELYLEQTKAAGYIVEENEYPAMLVDRGEFLHLLCEDDDEGWFVGRWYKSTPTKSGDYNGYPEFEDKWLDKCLTYIRDWSPVTK